MYAVAVISLMFGAVIVMVKKVTKKSGHYANLGFVDSSETEP